MVSRTETILRRERMESRLPDLIESFLATKQVEGRSPKTISWYRANLTRFSEYAGHPALKDLTVDLARRFVAHLQSKTVRYEGHPKHPERKGGLSPYTIHGYVRTLKAFASWLQEEGLTSSNIFSRLKRPKLPKPMIEILSKEELKQIFAAINPDSFLGCRLQVIVGLLCDTGIRASELTGLTLEDVHLNEGYLRVVGKGSKERIVPFGADMKKVLLRYIHHFRPEPASDGVDELVLTVNGETLSYDGLLQILKRLGRRAKVPRLHPHLFRHTYAVRYLLAEGDVITLGRLLGHSTLDATRMYLHLSDAHIQIRHNQFSLVDSLSLAKRRRRR